jgi:predicted CoA-binding protein
MASINGNWRDNLIDDAAGISQLLLETNTIAVLGIKTAAQAGQPALYVPQYMQRAGYKIIPVPVYYPEVTEILGERVYRQLTDIPGDVDMVNIFRRPVDIPAHVSDILTKKPKSVWMQLGISHDEVARELAEAGIKVVQDRCLMVDHRRFG